MKKIVIAFVILACCGLMFAADPVAYLIKSKGNIQIYRDQKSIKFKNGELLYNNDELITSAQAYAAIKYVDGAATIKVFPNSVVRITASKQDKILNKSVVVQVGSLYSKISRKIKGGFQTETPNTVASVKGTGFITRYNADKKTHIIVLEGEVLVQNKDSGKSKTVARGSSGICGTDGEVSLMETQPGDITDEEMNEIESLNQDVQKSMRIQLKNDNGDIKYLDITY